MYRSGGDNRMSVDEMLNAIVRLLLTIGMVALQYR
jgi:hypothetical protein